MKGFELVKMDLVSRFYVRAVVAEGAHRDPRGTRRAGLELFCRRTNKGVSFL